MLFFRSLLYLAPLGDLNVRVRKDELADSGVKREAVNAISHCEHQYSRGRVHAVPCDERRSVSYLISHRTYTI